MSAATHFGFAASGGKLYECISCSFRFRCFTRGKKSTWPNLNLIFFWPFYLIPYWLDLEMCDFLAYFPLQCKYLEALKAVEVPTYETNLQS